MTPAPSSHRNDDAGVDGSDCRDNRKGPSPPPPPSSSTQKDFSCVICWDGVEEPVVTQCGHLYCWSCLYQWLEPGITSEERQVLFQKRGRTPALSRPLQTTPSRGTTSQPDGTRRVCPTCKAPCSVSTVVPIFVGDVQDNSANEERSQTNSTRNDNDAAASSRSGASSFDDRGRQGAEMPSRPLPMVSSTTPASTRRVRFALQRGPPGFGEERPRRLPSDEVGEASILFATPSPEMEAWHNAIFRSLLERMGAPVVSPFRSPSTQSSYHSNASATAPTAIPMDLDTEMSSSFGMAAGSSAVASSFGGTPSTNSDGHHQPKRQRQPAAQQPFETLSTANASGLSDGLNSLSLGRSAPRDNIMGYFGVMGSIQTAERRAQSNFYFGSGLRPSCGTTNDRHSQIPRGGGITGQFCPGLTVQDMVFSIGGVVEKKPKPVYQPRRSLRRRRRPRM